MSLLVQVYKRQHQLKCRFHTNNNHPLLILSPARQEEIYHDPYLVFYHQVLTDYEIDVIKQLATPKVSISTEYNIGCIKINVYMYSLATCLGGSKFDSQTSQTKDFKLVVEAPLSYA